MMMLSDFQIIRPAYETDQKTTLDWLVDAHTEAEIKKGHLDPATFRLSLQEKLWRIGCKPDRIGKRGHVITDYLHRDWDKMDIYRLSEAPNGRDLSIRSKCFEKEVDHVFETYYPENAIPPDDMIHVSCTGYVSPSGAQKIVSKRNWGHQTTITHAYHMGCYGSIPALRMANGFLASNPKKNNVDIIHTEICSLHTHPANHEADQLVSQSLFADGFIKYQASQKSSKPHMKVLSIQEEIIPNSSKAMTWNVSHFGFQMTLAKEIPVLISRALPDFLKHLAQKTYMDADELIKKALFAVHPGGPKILVYIQDLFKLSEQQMTSSFEILKNYGNMSSATLPHIWETILSDAKIPDHTLIVSLAFGPGLSITGAIMEKVCGS